MGEILNQPFVSESYDRLMAAQALHKAKSAVLDAKPVLDVIRIINTPVSDLRAAREALSLTQAAMADALGIDAPRLSKMESKTHPIDARTDLAVRCLLAQVAK